jgi:hypothetical protein
MAGFAIFACANMGGDASWRRSGSDELGVGKHRLIRQMSPVQRARAHSIGALFQFLSEGREGREVYLQSRLLKWTVLVARAKEWCGSRALSIGLGAPASTESAAQSYSWKRPSGAVVAGLELNLYSFTQE